MSTPAVSQLLSKIISGSISVYTAWALELPVKRNATANEAYCESLY